MIGTTHNSDRLETIDYVFYDEDLLEVVARSPLLAPFPDPVPDYENPSDHIPLVVRLRMREVHW